MIDLNYFFCIIIFIIVKLFGESHENVLPFDIPIILELINYGYSSIILNCLTACAYFTNGNKSSQYWSFNHKYYQDKAKKLCNNGLDCIMDIINNSLHSKYGKKSKEILTYSVATVYGIANMGFLLPEVSRKYIKMFLDVLNGCISNPDIVEYHTSLLVLDVFILYLYRHYQ